MDFKSLVIFSLAFLFVKTVIASAFYLPRRSKGVNYQHVDLYDSGIRLAGRTTMIFQIRAKNDAHILLQRDRSDYLNNVIEIVIGGWGNSKSVIRDAQQGSPKDEYRDNGILSSNLYRDFWVSWASGCIKVGKGPTPYSNEIMSWCGLAHACNYVAIGVGYGSDGYFNIPQSSPCDSNPCQNGATCSGTNVYSCTCAPGWTGSTCSEASSQVTFYLPRRSKGVNYQHVDLYNNGIRLAGRTTMLFRVKAKNDGHILLQRDRSDYRNNVIEIVIGGWGNSKSVIRDAQQGSPKDEYKEGGILSSSLYRDFWVSWASGCIKVGKGFTPYSNEIMSWCGLAHACNYVAIGVGYGSDGYFSIVQPYLTLSQTKIEDGLKLKASADDNFKYIVYYELTVVC